MASNYPLDDAHSPAAARAASRPAGAIERHAAPDRWFHWITALTMFVLLGTGLLPIVGIRFAWVEIHWIAGIVLTAAVLFHIVRSLFRQQLRAISVRWRDVRELTAHERPGKYTIAQKLMHHAFALSLLVAVVTGLMLLAKVETPFLERDPYLFTERTWGIVHALHDFSALLAVTLVIVHVYFALLPEKRMYLRAMTKGWMTGEEAREHHDPQRWPGAAERRE